MDSISNKTIQIAAEAASKITKLYIGSDFKDRALPIIQAACEEATAELNDQVVELRRYSAEQRARVDEIFHASVIDPPDEAMPRAAHASDQGAGKLNECGIPCPFCGGRLGSEYASTGASFYCDSCHGEFTFPAFENEVIEMWQRTLSQRPTSATDLTIEEIYERLKSDVARIKRVSGGAKQLLDLIGEPTPSTASEPLCKRCGTSHRTGIYGHEFESKPDPAPMGKEWTPEYLHSIGIFTTEQMCDAHNATLQSDDTKRLVRDLLGCLKHLSWSNHGFKPDSCAYCEQARKLMDDAVMRKETT